MRFPGVYFHVDGPTTLLPPTSHLRIPPLAYAVDDEASALDLTFQVDNSVFRALRARPRAAGRGVAPTASTVTM